MNVPLVTRVKMDDALSHPDALLITNADKQKFAKVDDVEKDVEDTVIAISPLLAYRNLVKIPAYINHAVQTLFVDQSITKLFVNALMVLLVILSTLVTLYKKSLKPMHNVDKETSASATVVSLVVVQTLIAHLTKHVCRTNVAILVRNTLLADTKHFVAL